MNIEGIDKSIVDDEGLTLIELLMILWKHKKMIAFVTLFAVIITAIVNFFIIKPTYEATTTIAVSDRSPATGFFGSNTTVVLPGQNDIDWSQVKSDDVEKDISLLLTSILKYNGMSTEAFKQEVTNPQVLLATISQLNLDPKKYDLDNFKKNLKVAIIDKTNFITITVKENDPNLAATIADSIASNFKTYITQKKNQETDQIAATLENLIKQQNAKISTATEELNKMRLDTTIAKSVLDQKQTEIDLLTKSRDVMIEKYTMVELLKVSNVGDQVVSNVTNALVPSKPIAPKKLLNIALAFIIGLCIGCFLAFAIESWKGLFPANKLFFSSSKPENAVLSKE